MDKASQHYKSKKVIKYFEDNKDTLIPVYLPTASPEFMVMEEVLEYSQARSTCPKILSHHLQILKTRYPDISEQKDSILI